MAGTAVLSRVGAGVTLCPAPSAAGAGPAGSDCAGWVGALSPAVIGGSQAAHSQITAINPSAGAQASGMVRNAPRIRFGQGEAAAAAGSGPAERSALLASLRSGPGERAAAVGFVDLGYGDRQVAQLLQVLSGPLRVAATLPGGIAAKLHGDDVDDLRLVHAEQDEAWSGSRQEIDGFKHLHQIVRRAAVEVVDEDDEAGVGRGAQGLRCG